MPREAKIISIFCLVADLLKEISHKEDNKRKVSDSKIITTAIVSALYFGGHQDNTRGFMKMTRFSPDMLDKIRFWRRLHDLHPQFVHQKPESLRLLYLQLPVRHTCFDPLCPIWRICPLLVDLALHKTGVLFCSCFVQVLLR